MRPAAVFLLLAPALFAQPFDLAPFARPCCSQDSYSLPTWFDYRHPSGLVRRDGGGWVYGLQWAEERDISEVRLRFRTPYDTAAVRLEYWQKNWPCPPPAMPAIEDPADDPWQGRWIAPKTIAGCDGLECGFRFPALDTAENPNASNLPALIYRRTVKLRLVFPAGVQPEVAGVQVFNGSTTRRVQLRLRFEDARPGAPPAFHAYNGWIREARQTADGMLLTVDAAEPGLPGSHDIAIVKVTRGQDAFSFIPSDAERGPVSVPDYHACITLASSDVASCRALVTSGARIRERLAAEPEQTYERARREIPPLDPVERQGGRLYLPLAAEASWQKFALEWGGNVFIGKRQTKAKGRELERLAWPGDRISWRIGTGETPGFRPAAGDSTLRQLDDTLPVAVARWSSDGLEYEQESFATLLSGPLSPDDPGRSEQTPAVLMMAIRVRNPRGVARIAHVWIGMSPPERLRFENGLLMSEDGSFTRASLRLPATASARLDTCREEGREAPSLHAVFRVGGGGESVVELALPFIPALSAAQRERLARLDGGAERRRVVEYWRAVTEKALPFRVPEPVFNTFARGLPARIRVSVTKDPKSGLYMVPAASYGYQVFANEAAFQSQLLDVLGQHDLSAAYLRTLVELQGSKPMPGTYTGDQKPVYHGARVDAQYDYTASGYNLDHGAVLWTLAEHYFLTRDRAWFSRVAGSLKRAADWIVEQRRRTMVLDGGAPCPEYGLLPAGHLEDNGDWGHWFSVNAYASAGMSGLAAALRDARDPDAPRYTTEAESYRADLRRAVLRAAAEAPVIRLRDNTWVPYVPTRPIQRIRLFGPLRVAYYSRYPQKLLPTYRLSATREVLYGPLILLDTGIFDVDEPIAPWVLDDWEDNATMSQPLGLHVHGWVDEHLWFSRGGMVFQANLQNPIRVYLRRGEARAAIRSLYNNFVACHYPSVNAFTEEYREWGRPSGPFFKVPDEAKFVHRLRDMLITEYRDELLLAPGAPSRWFSPGREIAVIGAPTHFGPLSYTLRGAEDEVRGRITLPVRNQFRRAWVYIRLPEDRRIASVLLDGKPWAELDRSLGRIALPRSGHEQALVVRIAKVR